MAEIRKVATHHVFKISDVKKALTEEDVVKLNILIDNIKEICGEKKYYIVNLDEPYADKVIKLIIAEEDKKERKKLNGRRKKT